MLFYNSNEVRFVGLENVYVTPAAITEAGTIYVSEQAFLYADGTVFGNVVCCSDAVKAKKKYKKFVCNKHLFVKKQVAVEPTHIIIPFYGTSRKGNVFFAEPKLILAFSSKRFIFKNAISSSMLLFHARNSIVFLVSGLIKNNFISSRFTLLYSVFVSNDILGRAPTFLIYDFEKK